LLRLYNSINLFYLLLDSYFSLRIKLLLDYLDSFSFTRNCFLNLSDISSTGQIYLDSVINTRIYIHSSAVFKLLRSQNSSLCTGKIFRIRVTIQYGMGIGIGSKNFNEKLCFWTFFSFSSQCDQVNTSVLMLFVCCKFALMCIIQYNCNTFPSHL